MRHFKSVLLSIVLVLTMMGMELLAANPPLTQAGFITFQNTTNSGTTMNWVNGSGAGRIVVVSTTNNFATYPPINNTTYSVAPVDVGNYAAPANPTLGTGKVIYNGTGSTNSVNVTGLAANTSYWFRVYDYNIGGTPSPAYNTNQRTLNPRQLKTAPATPINLAANNITSYSATLSWSQSAGATSYRLDVSTGTGINFNANIVEPYNDLDIGDITEWELIDLTQNTDYWFRVRAVANGMSSENSVEFLFHTNAAVAPTFSMQYYADAALTQSLGANPRLGVGTYYLALTADQPLQYAPGIRIDANGNGVWNDACDVFPEETNILTSYGEDVYVFTRTIVADPLLDGINPEDYIVFATSLSGIPTNHAPHAAISNYGDGAATVDTYAPEVTNVSCTVPGDGTYGIGENITILVDFDDNVYVTGEPRIRLNVGPGVIRYATYDVVAGGTGTGTLAFLYTVQTNDFNSDLDYFNNASLLLNGGTISDDAGNPALLALPVPGAAGSLSANNTIVVDGITPVITNVTSNLANGTYGAGQIVDILVTFSEDVAIAGGTPELLLNTTPAQSAEYASYDAGTFTATFNYTVVEGDNSALLDYAAFDALTLEGATIQDAAGNDANTDLFTPNAVGSLSFNKNIVIDAVVPVISNVTSQNFNGTYGVGQQIIVEVLFNKNVFVAGGIPTIELNAGPGGAGAFATYNGIGSGTNTLQFSYVVLEGNESADLNYLAVNSLVNHGATIKDASNTIASPILPDPAGPNSLGSNKDIVIDGVIKAVTDVYSDSPDGSYGASSLIIIKVEFETEVIVEGGTPQITLNTIPQGICNYVEGSGTNTLEFLYMVPQGVTAADLDYTSIDALELNSATLQDAVGNDINTTLPDPGVPGSGSLSDNNNIEIDAVAPTVVNVTSPTATYSLVGSVINISVNFSKIVNVNLTNGSPTLALNIGGVTQYATYAIGTGTTELVFNYTVQAGDVQNPLEYANINALELNGAEIYDNVDFNANDADLTLPALGSANSLAASGVKINTVVPIVNNVTSVPAIGTYKAGDVVAVIVQFSEPVEVVTTSGNPRIRLNIQNTNGSYIPRYAQYTSGTGTNTLQFAYAVQNGDNSAGLDYYHIVNPALYAFDLNGGTIKSVATLLNASTQLPAVGAPNSLGVNTDIIIDTKSPVVTNVTSANTGLLETGDVVTIDVTFDEVVNISPNLVNTARLLLETGAIDHYAYYNGTGNGTTTLQFEYTVEAADYTEHLDYFDQWSLETVTGTIKDLADNNATLDLPEPGTPGSLGANTNIFIVGDTPYVTNVISTNADGAYTIGDNIVIQVVFNNAVDVDGIPQLQLQTNNGDKYASYTAGTGSNTLTFEYTIVAGDFTTDLDYTATNALTGVIYAAGTTDNAILTLPAPGTAGSLGANNAIEISTVAPDVTVTFNNFAAGVATFDVVFTQNVVGFDTPATDVNAGGTAFSGVPNVNITPIDGANYTVTVTGMDQNGTVTVQIPVGAAQNGVGLDNTESNLETYNYNLTAPTVVITDAYASTLATDQLPITFTVTFDMPVNGFNDPVNDVLLFGTANVTNVAIRPAIDGLTEYFVDVTVDENGTVQIQIPAGAAQSVGGGVDNEVSLPSNEITFTAPAPEVVSITPEFPSTTTLPINFTVEFNEDVNGFDETGITIAGTASAGANATVTGAGTTYNVAINNVTVLGTINITVNADAAQNSFGTGNLVFGPSADVTYWGIAPIPEIDYAGDDPTSLTTIDFIVIFDQDVTGFDSDDINIGGTAFTPAATKVKEVTGNGTTYNVAVSGMDQAGTVNINFAAGAAQNAGGKQSVIPVLTYNQVDFEVAAPNVTINKAFGQADPTGTQPIWFDVVFDQNVTGFDNAAVVNVVSDNPLQGPLSVNIQSIDAQHYQVRVADISKNGIITATIPAGVAINGFGVPNEASTSIDNTVEFEAAAPSLLLEIADGQVSPATTEPVLFTATFDQIVTGFDALDIIIGGTAEPLTTVTVDQDLVDPMVYHISIENIGQNGTLNVAVNADVAFNSYGTGNLAAEPSDDVYFFGIAPTATIERKAGQGSPTNALPIEFTVTFDQLVTDFDDSDINFDNTPLPSANPSNITVTPVDLALGYATTYTVSIGNVANNGNVLIGFGPNAAVNAGGVGNTAPVYDPNIAGVTVEFTMPAPTCVIALAGGQVSPTNLLPLVFTATFSQNVWGLIADDIDVTFNGNPYNDITITGGVGGDAVYTISVNNLPASGEVELFIPADAAQNQYAEGNILSNTQNCVYDITRPTPTITLVSPDPTNQTPVVYTVEFDEPVFGFDANALTVNGPFAGAATIDVTAVGVGGTEWTIEISGMNADGLVALSVNENAVTDLAQNGNFPAGPVTCQYNIPPTPPPGPAANALSVKYFTRTTIKINIIQPELPTILIGKQVAAGPLAPVLAGDIADYALIANLAFNHTGTLDDGSCVLYVGNENQITITALQRNKAYTFALYTYNPETGLYCLDADAALLSQTTQNRESLTEQPGAIAGVNLALSQISPNPVVNNVNLTMDLFTDANITVQVIDGNGQVISVPVNGNFYAEGTHTLSFPLQNVASGSYILRVSTGNEAVIQRFIYMP